MATKEQLANMLNIANEALVLCNRHRKAVAEVEQELLAVWADKRLPPKVVECKRWADKLGYPPVADIVPITKEK